MVSQDPPKPISELYFTHQAESSTSGMECTSLRHWNFLEAEDIADSVSPGQEHVPFYPRQRILIWTNYKLLMKAGPIRWAKNT